MRSIGPAIASGNSEPRQIRVAIDTKYASQIELATPTPYPPA